MSKNMMSCLTCGHTWFPEATNRVEAGQYTAFHNQRRGQHDARLDLIAPKIGTGERPRAEMTMGALSIGIDLNESVLRP